MENNIIIGLASALIGAAGTHYTNKRTSKNQELIEEKKLLYQRRIAEMSIDTQRKRQIYDTIFIMAATLELESDEIEQQNFGNKKKDDNYYAKKNKIVKKLKDFKYYFYCNRRYISEDLFNMCTYLHCRLTDMYNENPTTYETNYTLRSNNVEDIFKITMEELGQLQSLSPNDKWLNIIRVITSHNDLTDKEKLQFILNECHNSQSINNCKWYRLEIIKEQNIFKKFTRRIQLLLKKSNLSE